MKNMQDIDRALRTVEAKVARLKAAAGEREDRVRSKIAALRGFTASDEATDVQRLEIRKSLAALESKMQNIMPPLEDVEKEVDRIYGDQSLNNTYYFSRRNLKASAPKTKVAAFLRQGESMEIPWTELSYDQVAEVIDDIYGNQSDNSTYYFNRSAHTVRLVEEVLSRKASMTLQQVMDQMDSLYGDLSKNETYYPSRRYDEQARLDMTSTACDCDDVDDEKDADWRGDEEHHLLSESFDDSGHQSLSAGYEIPGTFSNDNFDSHNTVAPTYRVDNTVETFGYWGDQTDEMPEIVQNRSASVPKVAALSGVDQRVLQAFLDHRPMEGKTLVTDGVTLEKMGMGGRVMAEWVRGKVEATDDTHVKSDEVILRALKKHTPRNLLITSPTL